MRTSRAGAFAALLVLFASCSAPRTRLVSEVVPGQAINQEGKFLILSCEDAQERGEDVAKGSSNALVSAVRDQMMRHSMKISITQSTALEAAYTEAKANSFDYLLRPVFTHWEDNATAWSMNGDKVGISLEVYDARTRAVLAAASYNRTATGATFVAGSPMRFIVEAAEKTLNQIFHWQG
jgi:hypothetical protein